MNTEELTVARGATYGAPQDNHQRTANLWSAFLSNRKVSGPLTPTEVCWLNILQKIARAQEGIKHDDHWRDVQGYAENIREIWNYEAGKN
jgi:hypothetical protein